MTFWVCYISLSPQSRIAFMFSKYNTDSMTGFTLSIPTSTHSLHIIHFLLEEFPPIDQTCHLLEIDVPIPCGCVDVSLDIFDNRFLSDLHSLSSVLFQINILNKVVQRLAFFTSQHDGTIMWGLLSMSTIFPVSC